MWGGGGEPRSVGRGIIIYIILTFFCENKRQWLFKWNPKRLFPERLFKSKHAGSVGESETHYSFNGLILESSFICTLESTFNITHTVFSVSWRLPVYTLDCTSFRWFFSQSKLNCYVITDQGQSQNHEKTNFTFFILSNHLCHPQPE